MPKTEDLIAKVGWVVERSEAIDPEDDKVSYSLVFVIDRDSEFMSQMRIETDDKEFFARFVINEEYDLSFLKKEKAGQPKLITRTN